MSLPSKLPNIHTMLPPDLIRKLASSRFTLLVSASNADSFILAFHPTEFALRISKYGWGFLILSFAPVFFIVSDFVSNHFGLFVVSSIVCICIYSVFSAFGYSRFLQFDNASQRFILWDAPSHRPFRSVWEIKLPLCNVAELCVVPENYDFTLRATKTNGKRIALFRRLPSYDTAQSLADYFTELIASGNS